MCVSKQKQSTFFQQFSIRQCFTLCHLFSFFYFYFALCTQQSESCAFTDINLLLNNRIVVCVFSLFLFYQTIGTTPGNLISPQTSGGNCGALSGIDVQIKNRACADQLSWICQYSKQFQGFFPVLKHTDDFQNVHLNAE